MEQVRVRVLGPVEVLAPGRAVAVPGGRPRVVLAVLALHAGQAVGADRLAAALWDDRLPTNVRASLQTCVARLRRALDSDDLIETVRSGYVLRLDPEDVDLHRFRRLAAEAELLGDPIGARRVLVEALALWRGEPLTGVDSEALRRGEARGLTEEYLAAVERRVDLDMAAGRLEDLVPELRSLVGRYRLRESLWSRLILTQYRLGRAAEAIETYHKLRTVWVESLGVEPSGPVRQLYQGMLTGEMAQTPRMLPKPPPAAALARPWQIPADVRHFAGRRAELAALDELVVRNDSHAMFAVLDGSAGVGKTALAVRWAHRVRDRFPDGQLYLNLRGYGPGEPVRPETALSGFLRALGARADQIPDGLNERSAKFRNRLAGRRMLVLLDNARDAAQVRPLLPGAGNALLVTSRNQLRGLTARNGASRVEVARLSPEDAADLLNEHIAGPRTAAESDTVAELVELCARLPLALRVTAERINRSLGLPLAALARELRDERGRLDVLRSDDDQDADLRALLSWSYLALDGASARAFRLLGIHPGNDIGSAAAAALFDISEGEAAQLLDSLVSVHLLEQRTGDRYGFHDLLRGYAAETAQREVSATDRDVATRRILDWYLHTSYEGHYQLQPTVTPEFKLTRSLVAPLRLHTDVAALAWFDAELANLVALSRYALDRGEFGTVIRLHRGMRGYLTHRCREDEWIATAAMTLEAARRTGDRSAEAFAVDSIGMFHSVRFQFRQALPYHQSGLRMLGPVDRGPQWARAVTNVGLAQMFTGRLDEAVACFERVLSSDWAEGTSVLLNLGGAYGMQGRYQDALDVSTRAADLYERHGVRRLHASALRNIAEAHHYLEHHRLAESTGRRALGLVRDLGDRIGEADTLILLGRILQGAGRLKHARNVFRNALGLLTAAGDRDSDLVRQARDELAALSSRRIA